MEPLQRVRIRARLRQCISGLARTTSHLALSLLVVIGCDGDGVTSTTMFRCITSDIRNAAEDIGLVVTITSW